MVLDFHKTGFLSSSSYASTGLLVINPAHLLRSWFKFYFFPERINITTKTSPSLNANLTCSNCYLPWMVLWLLSYFGLRLHCCSTFQVFGLSSSRSLSQNSSFPHSFQHTKQNTLHLKDVMLYSFWSPIIVSLLYVNGNRGQGAAGLPDFFLWDAVIDQVIC